MRTYLRGVVPHNNNAIGLRDVFFFSAAFPFSASIRRLYSLPIPQLPPEFLRFTFEN